MINGMEVKVRAWTWDLFGDSLPWDVGMLVGNQPHLGSAAVEIWATKPETLAEIAQNRPALRSQENSHFIPYLEFYGTAEELFKLLGWDMDGLDDLSREVIRYHIEQPPAEGVFMSPSEIYDLPEYD